MKILMEYMLTAMFFFQAKRFFDKFWQFHSDLIRHQCCRKDVALVKGGGGEISTMLPVIHTLLHFSSTYFVHTPFPCFSRLQFSRSLLLSREYAHKRANIGNSLWCSFPITCAFALIPEYNLTVMWFSPFLFPFLCSLSDLLVFHSFVLYIAINEMK